VTAGPLAGRDLYDDPAFFDRYQRLRAARAGLNDELEQPALARLLPPLRGARVIELGCGDGALARRLADAGAQRVLAVDGSERMLALAAGRPHPRVRYLRADIETLSQPAASADCVVSSLALHYVRDYRGLVGRVARWLRPGGQFVFSMEHPVCTAANPMTGWLTAGGGTVWPVDHYAEETGRSQQWLGRGVLKYHRRVATVVGAILAAGLAVTGLDEPWPGDEAVARRPDLAQHRRRPPILLVAARKAAGPDAGGAGGRRAACPGPGG
jgi:ubiquinone/menaquinone biosynthesis C-methylase UbiE